MALAAARLRRPHARTDGPPVFSQEFVIQNHADIISCVCVVIFLGLLPQATNELASKFIFLQYNETIEAEQGKDVNTSRVDNIPLPETQYKHGLGDALNVIFYSLIWIIIHALVQEYIWERTVRRLRLSKTKTSKYLDSGMMVVFFFVSLILGVDHIIKGNYLVNYGTPLWEGYPHILMTLSLKFYMLIQMAYWVHCYPELYFMKVKKDEVYSKLVLYTTSLLIITAAYITYLQRLAVILLVCHYAVEFVFHASRLLHYHGRNDVAQVGFKVWWILFILARLITVGVSVMTLWFGVQKGEEPVLLGKIDLTTPVIRLSGLVFIIVIQLWLLLTFVSQQRERQKRESATQPSPVMTKKKPTSPRQKKTKKKE